MLKIETIAKKAGIPKKYLEPYGFYKAKISPDYYASIKNNKDGKLILMTAITPTKAGEGKTTSAIALADGMKKIGEQAMLCLREPALGPVFGLKGGATGGGKATVEPSNEINLHFTGDMHALTSSISLINAIIDNYLYQGNPLNIDPNRIIFKRAVDMNDRDLREITIAEGEKNGVQHQSGFQITVANELMAILCLALDENDFLRRLEKVVVAYTYDNKPVTVKDLKVTHSVMRLMKEALKVNLVQTKENNPVFIHGGPFANIAHGCNSLIATRTALKMAPYVITEAGFASDLGAEKFFDIACPNGNLHPDLAVLVCSIRALKLHGGQLFKDLNDENLEALEKGLPNLFVHYENLQKFKLPVVIAINHFPGDTDNEVKLLEKVLTEKNIPYAFLDGYLKGGEGSKDLARLLVKILKEKESHYEPLYTDDMPLEKKIEIVAKEIYRSKEVVYSDKALEQLKEFKEEGLDNLKVCIAKTPNSLSDDPKLLGAPLGNTLHIREINLSAGAGFIVPLTGEVMTMPGLPKNPLAVKMEDEPW